MMHELRKTLTIGQIPHRHAELQNRAHKLAVIQGPKRLTWSQVSERTARLANALSGLGVGRGDRVATILPNRAEYVESVYAIAGLGAAVAPISYRFIATEMANALEYLRPTAVIVDESLIEQFETANGSLSEPLANAKVLVVGARKPTDFESYDDVLAKSSASLSYLHQFEDDIYHLGFTGGTSGNLKACMIPQRLARQLWLEISNEIGIGESDTMLIAGPFYHGMGFTWGLQQLLCGGTIVMLESFDAREVLRQIEKEKITVAPMAPTMYSMILDVADKDVFDVSSMRYLVSAAAPLLSTTKEGLLRCFESAGLFELYGSTEVGFFTVLKPEDQLRKIRCAGQPWAGSEIRIMDAIGNPVPLGQVGLIYKRGSTLGVGYFDKPELTEETFNREWVNSGDLGKVDEEGYLYVVDRADDMIISGGVNIFPTEIEEVLSRHGLVSDVAVIGQFDEKWGQAVHAFIVPIRGDALTAEELDGYCRANMASYKRPRVYHFVEELPRNASGKLLKRVLARTAQPAP